MTFVTFVEPTGPRYNSQNKTSLTLRLYEHQLFSFILAASNTLGAKHVDNFHCAAVFICMHKEAKQIKCELCTV